MQRPRGASLVLDAANSLDDVFDPFIIPENSQGLSHRLVNAGGANFNHMFNLLEVDTGYFARLQSHEDVLSYFAFSSSTGRLLSAFEVEK